MHTLWIFLTIGMVLLGGPRLIGALFTMMILSTIVAVPVVGALLLGWGHYGAMWATAAALALLGLLCGLIEAL